MKINFTTNIRTNTRKFSSVDELPPDLRKAYDEAVASGTGKLATTEPKIVTRLVVNGHEVDIPKAMSEAEEKLVSDVVEMLKSSGAITDSPGTTSVPSPAGDAPRQPAVDTGWLTRKQWNLILVAIIVIGVALAIALTHLR